MELKCFLGFHKWEAVMEKREKPEWRWVTTLVVPSLFAGPPFEAPLFPYKSTHRIAGFCCERCGQTKKAKTY